MYQKTKLKSPVYALNTLTNKKLYKYIQDNNYNYIVTTHLFAGQALTKIKKEHKIKFMEIATDYVCIPFWQETNPDYIVIPHKDLEKEFYQKGFKKEQILPIGIPASTNYTKKYNIGECKKELNLDENKKYILVLSGSMGFGNVLEIVEELLKEIENTNFIISCGTNKKLIEALNKKFKTNDNITILSYTNKLYKYMASSEIILTKPGGLTTTEISTIRKPFILTAPIPGCENYNADFFASRKMAIKCNNTVEIAKNTNQLLNNKDLQKEMITNQEKYINANACEDICNIIINELEG
jgi:processive 1,2-diacylglycerol beta-glucosyltransferase